MNFCVLGLGKTGQAMMAYLLHKGQRVLGWNRSQDKVSDVSQLGIAASGAITGHFEARATMDIGAALAEADFLLVLTLANAHRDIARLLAGKLKQNSRIIVFNGCWGACEFYSELKPELEEKNVLLAETSGMLIMSKLVGKAAPQLSTVKQELALASIPKQDAGRIAAELKDVFPQFTLAGNAVETSINNSNPVLHCPIALLNMARLENAEDYGFYTDAVSPSVARFVEAIDEERCAVAKAVGAVPTSCLSILNGFWGQNNKTLYDAILNNEDYRKIRGPKTLKFRFVTEDLPYGMMPVAALGARYGVKTPAIDALISIFRYAIDPSVPLSNGPDFERLDLAALL